MTDLGYSREWVQRFGEAQKLLAAGDYVRGWAALNRHSGGSLHGRTVCVQPDPCSGFGDQVQMARYVPLLAERAARVYLLVGRQLVRLFRGLKGVSGVASAYGPESLRFVPVTDASLPHLLGADTENIPPAPYLRALPDDIERWRCRLPMAPFRVGLVWRGSTRTPRDPVRSLPSLATLASVLQVPGVTFVSLQKGAGEDEARAAPLPHLGSDVADFADTAAILEQLDLLISVDTGTAHVAGALGKPVWLLLDNIPDWRWREPELVRRWYPTARVFRQRTQGDWSGPVNEAATALRVVAATVADATGSER